MEDLFITEDFVLDLSHVRISYQQENPQLKDTFFSTYSFPFTLELDGALRAVLGHRDSLQVEGLARRIEGVHQWEGRIDAAVLELLSIEGGKVEAKIESKSALVNLFERKLTDLPFESIAVGSLLQEARRVQRIRGRGRALMNVKYRFPYIQINKPGEQVEGRPGSVNALIGEDVPRENSPLHVCPLLLYVLKVGFESAGYTFEWPEALSELDNVCIYSAHDYYVAAGSAEVALRGDIDQFEQGFLKDGYQFGRYKIEHRIEQAGGWRLVCHNYRVWNQREPFSYKIYLDDSLVKEEAFGATGVVIDFSQELEVTRVPATLRIMIEGVWDPRLVFRLRQQGVVADGNAPRVLQQPTVVDLRHWLPDISFGQLFRALKNWLNLEVEDQDEVIRLRKFDHEDPALQDLTPFEVAHPKLSYNPAGGYLLSFPEGEEGEDKIPNVYISQDQVRVGSTRTLGVHEVKIEGYALPPRTGEGNLAPQPQVVIHNNTTLGLVKHIDMREGKIGSSATVEELSPAGTAERLKDWYQMRIGRPTLQWEFVVNKNRFRSFKINRMSYVYKRRAIIKSWTKESISPRLYKVQIEVILL